MKAIFIDTNIFLLFYHFSQDDLSILEKLQDHLSNKKLTLYLTSQVKDEFFRNRENKILDALKIFKEINFSIKIPTLFKDFDADCNKLIKQKKEFEKLHTVLMEKVTIAAKNSELKADKIIDSIFDSANHIVLNDNIYQIAVKRSKLGNPPGKKGDVCDAINWQLLVDNIAEGTDLIIISADGDYSSLLENKIHPFLKAEWEQKKSSKVELYKSLTQFFDKYIPNLQLKDEKKEIIDNLIMSLEESKSFQATHNVLTELFGFLDKLDAQQVNRIANAYLSNSQIRFIITDDDVKNFIKFVINKYDSIIKKEVIEKLNFLMLADEKND
jgi:hypothetical protein